MEESQGRLPGAPEGTILLPWPTQHARGPLATQLTACDRSRDLRSQASARPPRHAEAVLWKSRALREKQQQKRDVLVTVWIPE